ncbi:OLC1v1000844C1 [Oldenlandia corymbosa var. corymbosa]|uniref:WD40 repeat-containing protein SMU1 n=1 Tax=Oldenlandia corymbosa var. corymbosa TaxID=529605 RepID=A0AAV1D664_OLDCO|nr:OLC1v1000844C1 [Oldenlandia corymbosa var. corymbosa]
MASTLEIDAQDVVKLFLQFCKENSLPHTFQTLQNECRVSLNSVDNLETFMADVSSGRWESVIPHLSQLNLPRNLLADLLERLLVRPYFDPRELYPEHSSKEKRRGEIARALSEHVSVIPPSRLTVLIGQALKWHQHQGLLPPGTQFDLLRGMAAMRTKDVEDKHPTMLVRVIKFRKRNYPQCCQFTPDGQILVSGSSDGLIEVWDGLPGKLLTQDHFRYQANGDFMIHNDAVHCLAFSRDSEMLASGSEDGKVKIWRIRSGQCLRRLERAHSQGVTSVSFSRDGTQILSASPDGTARIHGLKSGRMLKEFRGQASFVNDARFAGDGNHVITASSDFTVKVWDVRNAECLRTFKPPPLFLNGGGDVALNSVHLFPKNPDDHIVVCNRSSYVYIMTLQGQVVKSFFSGKREGGDFVAACVSPKGEYIYCVGEDNKMYCFNYQLGK